MAEGFKDFAPGDILTAADVDDYLMRQAVMRFADASARTTALSGVLVEGMMSYLKDTNTVEVYDGSAWVGVGGVATANFTDTATGTYSSGGTNYKYLTFTSSELSLSTPLVWPTFLSSAGAPERPVAVAAAQAATYLSPVLIFHTGHLP